MILVDSSVWIDYFNGRNTPQLIVLDQLLSTQPRGTGLDGNGFGVQQ